MQNSSPFVGKHCLARAFAGVLAAMLMQFSAPVFAQYVTHCVDDTGAQSNCSVSVTSTVRDDASDPLQVTTRLSIFLEGDTPSAGVNRQAVFIYASDDAYTVPSDLTAFDRTNTNTLPGEDISPAGIRLRPPGTTYDYIVPETLIGKYLVIAIFRSNLGNSGVEEHPLAIHAFSVPVTAAPTGTIPQIENVRAIAVGRAWVTVAWDKPANIPPGYQYTLQFYPMGSSSPVTLATGTDVTTDDAGITSLTTVGGTRFSPNTHYDVTVQALGLPSAFGVSGAPVDGTLSDRATFQTALFVPHQTQRNPRQVGTDDPHPTNPVVDSSLTTDTSATIDFGVRGGDDSNLGDATGITLARVQVYTGTNLGTELQPEDPDARPPIENSHVTLTGDDLTLIQDFTVYLPELDSGTLGNSGNPSARTRRLTITDLPDAETTYGVTIYIYNTDAAAAAGVTSGRQDNALGSDLEVGLSAPLSTVITTGAEGGPALTAPTGLAVTDVGLFVGQDLGARYENAFVNLTWDDVSGVDNYRLTFRPFGGAETFRTLDISRDNADDATRRFSVSGGTASVNTELVRVLDSGGTALAESFLRRHTAYDVTIAALDGETVGPESDPVSFISPSTVKESEVGNTQVTLTWAYTPEVLGYNLMVTGGGTTRTIDISGETLDGLPRIAPNTGFDHANRRSVQYVLTGLEADTEYGLSVLVTRVADPSGTNDYITVSNNGDGRGTDITTRGLGYNVDFTTTNVLTLTAPADLAVSDADSALNGETNLLDDVAVTWTPVADAASYVLRLTPGRSSSETEEIPVSGGSTGSFDLDDLAFEVNYSLTIMTVASDAALNSEESAAVTFTTGERLAAPTGLALDSDRTTPSLTFVHLTWSEVTDDVGYELRLRLARIGSGGEAVPVMGEGAMEFTFEATNADKGNDGPSDQDETAGHQATGLTAGSTYLATVAATGNPPSTYDSPESAAFTITTPPAPTGPITNFVPQSMTTTTVIMGWSTDEVFGAEVADADRNKSAAALRYRGDESAGNDRSLGQRLSDEYTMRDMLHTNAPFNWLGAGEGRVAVWLAEGPGGISYADPTRAEQTVDFAPHAPGTAPSGQRPQAQNIGLDTATIRFRSGRDPRNAANDPDLSDGNGLTLARLQVYEADDSGSSLGTTVDVENRRITNGALLHDHTIQLSAYDRGGEDTHEVDYPGFTNLSANTQYGVTLRFYNRYAARVYQNLNDEDAGNDEPVTGFSDNTDETTTPLEVGLSDPYSFLFYTAAEAPGNVRVENVTATGALVLWDLPEERTDVRGYTVRFYRVGETVAVGERSAIGVNADRLDTSIGTPIVLDSNTEYEVTLATIFDEDAHPDRVNSAESDRVRFTTLEQTSEPIAITTTNLEVQEGITLVGSLEATGGDGTLTWSETIGGADAGFFQLSPAGELTWDGKDFENSEDADTNNEYEITVTVTDGTDNVSADVTVALQDVPETIQVNYASAVYSLPEGNSAEICVTPTKTSSGTLTLNPTPTNLEVEHTSTDGSAVASSDYTAVNTSQSFSPSDIRTQEQRCFTVFTTDDSEFEYDPTATDDWETFMLDMTLGTTEHLAVGVNAIVLGDAATVQITDNDSPPAPSGLELGQDPITGSEPRIRWTPVPGVAAYELTIAYFNPKSGSDPLVVDARQIEEVSPEDFNNLGSDQKKFKYFVSGGKATVRSGLLPTNEAYSATLVSVNPRSGEGNSDSDASAPLSFIVPPDVENGSYRTDTRLLITWRLNLDSVGYELTLTSTREEDGETKTETETISLQVGSNIERERPDRGRHTPDSVETYLYEFTGLTPDTEYAYSLALMSVKDPSPTAAEGAVVELPGGSDAELTVRTHSAPRVTLNGESTGASTGKTYLGAGASVMLEFDSAPYLETAQVQFALDGVDLPPVSAATDPGFGDRTWRVTYTPAASASGELSYRFGDLSGEDPPGVTGVVFAAETADYNRAVGATVDTTAPVFTPDSHPVSATQGVETTEDLALLVTEANIDDAVFTVTTGTLPDEVTLSAQGVLTIGAAAQAVADLAFTVTVTDPVGLTDTLPVALSITSSDSTGPSVLADSLSLEAASDTPAVGGTNYLRVGETYRVTFTLNEALQSGSTPQVIFVIGDGAGAVTVREDAGSTGTENQYSATYTVATGHTGALWFRFGAFTDTNDNTTEAETTNRGTNVVVDTTDPQFAPETYALSVDAGSSATLTIGDPDAPQITDATVVTYSIIPGLDTPDWGSVSGSTISFAPGDEVSAGDYTFRVTATDLAGNDSDELVVTVTVEKLDTPTGFARPTAGGRSNTNDGSLSQTRVILTWAVVPDATGYILTLSPERGSDDDTTSEDIRRDVTDASSSNPRLANDSESFTVWDGSNINQPHVAGNGVSTSIIGLTPNLDYSVTIRAFNAQRQSAPSAPVTFKTHANRLPRADAGIDQTVDANTRVTLDGGASNDPDSHRSADALSAWEWSQQGNLPAPVDFSSQVTSTPTFAFTPDTAGTYTFILTVTDGYGLTNTDTLDVVVEESGPVTPLDTPQDFGLAAEIEGERNINDIIKENVAVLTWRVVPDATGYKLTLSPMRDGTPGTVEIDIPNSGLGTLADSVYAHTGNGADVGVLHSADGGVTRSLTGLTRGTTYTATLIAVIAGDDTRNSAAATTRFTTSPLPAPADFDLVTDTGNRSATNTISATAAILTWAVLPDATGYVLTLNPPRAGATLDADGNEVVTIMVSDLPAPNTGRADIWNAADSTVTYSAAPGPGVTRSLVGLTPERTYTAKVKAVDANTDRESAVATTDFTTQDDFTSIKPARPVGGDDAARVAQDSDDVTLTDVAVMVSWEILGDATGYTLTLSPARATADTPNPAPGSTEEITFSFVDADNDGYLDFGDAYADSSAGYLLSGVGERDRILLSKPKDDDNPLSASNAVSDYTTESGHHILAGLGRLTPGRNYEVTVTASKGTESSRESDAFSFTTLAGETPPLDVPTDLTPVDITSTTATLSWTMVPDVTVYRLTIADYFADNVDVTDPSTYVRQVDVGPASEGFQSGRRTQTNGTTITGNIGGMTSNHAYQITVASRDPDDDTRYSAESARLNLISRPVITDDHNEPVITATSVTVTWRVNDAAAGYELVLTPGRGDDATTTLKLEHDDIVGNVVDVGVAPNEYQAYSYTVDNLDSSADYDLQISVTGVVLGVDSEDTTLESGSNRLEFTTLAAPASNNAPVITSDAAVSVNEGVTAVATLMATDADDDTLTWDTTIGGDDAAHFTLTDNNDGSAALVFVNAKDHENPDDDGTNGVYNIIVSVGDGTDTITQNMVITLVNVDEIITVGYEFSTYEGGEAAGSEICIIINTDDALVLSGTALSLNNTGADDTAIAPGDYSAADANASVSFATNDIANNARECFTVGIVDDDDFEPGDDETFNVTLSVPAGAAAAIGVNEVNLRPAVTTTVVSIEENDSLSITVTSPANTDLEASKVVSAADNTDATTTMQYVLIEGGGDCNAAAFSGDEQDYDETDPITLNDAADNGKQVCFRSTYEGTTVAFAASSEIGGIQLAIPADFGIPERDDDAEYDALLHDAVVLTWSVVPGATGYRLSLTPTRTGLDGTENFEYVAADIPVRDGSEDYPGINDNHMTAYIDGNGISTVLRDLTPNIDYSVTISAIQNGVVGPASSAYEFTTLTLAKFEAEVSVSPATIDEEVGGEVTYTLTITGPRRPRSGILLEATFGGTASDEGADSDYTYGSDTAAHRDFNITPIFFDDDDGDGPGTAVTFEASFVIDIKTDTIPEGSETVTLTLSNPMALNRDNTLEILGDGSAQLIIADDDSPSIIATYAAASGTRSVGTVDYAPEGATFTIEVVFGEVISTDNLGADLPSALSGTLSVGGTSLGSVALSGSGTTFSGPWTIPANLNVGQTDSLTLAITESLWFGGDGTNPGTALAGTNNIPVGGGGRSIVVDTEAPSVMDASNVAVTVSVPGNANSGFAIVGSTLQMLFTTSEPLEDRVAPSVTLAGAVATVTGGPTSWTATLPVATSHDQGAVAWTIDLTDDAGNTHTENGTQSDVVIDTVPLSSLSPADVDDQTWTVGDTIDLSLPATSEADAIHGFAPGTTLPDGMTLETSPFRLAGSPTTMQSAMPYTWVVADAAGNAVSTTFMITVNPASTVPVVTIEGPALPATEGDDLSFSVLLDAPAPEALTVPLTVTETGTTLGAPLPTEVHFVSGGSLVALEIPTVADDVVEGSSTVTVTLTPDSSADPAYELGDPSSAMGTVEDDDVASIRVSVQHTTLTTSENMIFHDSGSAGPSVSVPIEFTIPGITAATTTATALNGGFSFRYTLETGTADTSDYVGTGRTINPNPNGRDNPAIEVDANGRFIFSPSVAITDDSEIEGDETFTFTLRAVSATGGGNTDTYELVNPVVTEITIQDNEGVTMTITENPPSGPAREKTYTAGVPTGAPTPTYRYLVQAIDAALCAPVSFADASPEDIGTGAVYTANTEAVNGMRICFEASDGRLTGYAFAPIDGIDATEPDFMGASISAITTTVGAEYTGVALPTATDSNEPVTYSVSGLPAGLSFNPDTRIISGIPGTAGVNTYTYTATDAVGNTADLMFELTVMEASPPVFDESTLLVIATVGETFPTPALPSVTADDPTTLTYAVDSDAPAGVDLSGTDLVIPNSVAEGTHIFHVTVTDGDGLTGQLEVILRVRPAAEATELDLSGEDITEIPQIPASEAGLTELDISETEVTTLPDDLLEHVVDTVTDLDFSDTPLTTLPDDLLEGAAALEALDLSDTDLTALPDDLLDDTAALETLDISDTPVRALPAGLLDNVPDLTTLDLSGTQVGTADLPDDFFAGLTVDDGTDTTGLTELALPAGQNLVLGTDPDSLAEDAEPSDEYHTTRLHLPQAAPFDLELRLCVSTDEAVPCPNSDETEARIISGGPPVDGADPTRTDIDVMIPAGEQMSERFTVYQGSPVTLTARVTATAGMFVETVGGTAIPLANAPVVLQQTTFFQGATEAQLATQTVAIAHAASAAISQMLDVVQSRLNSESLDLSRAGDAGGNITLGGKTFGWRESGMTNASFLTDAIHTLCGTRGMQDGQRQSCELRSLGDLLRGGSFEYSTGNFGDVQNVSGWGQHMRGSFSGKLARGTGADATYDGELDSVYLGMDVERGDDTMFGLALSSVDGRVDIEVPGDDDKKMDIELDGVTPYMRWRGDDRNVWVMAGTASGNAKATGEEQTELRSRMVALGMNGRFDGERVQMTWKSDAHYSDINGESDLDSSSWRARHAVGFDFPRLWRGGVLKRNVEIGARLDGGDMQDALSRNGIGGGADLALGVTYSGALDLSLRAKTLVWHTNEDTQEAGLTLQVSRAARGDRGFQFALQPAWGDAVGGSSMWGSDTRALPGASSDAEGFDWSPREVTMKLGYGFDTPGANALVTPIVEWSQNGAQARTKLGVSVQSPFKSLDKLRLNMFMEESRMKLEGRLDF